MATKDENNCLWNIETLKHSMMFAIYDANILSLHPWLKKINTNQT